MRAPAPPQHSPTTSSRKPTPPGVFRLALPVLCLLLGSAPCWGQTDSLKSLLSTARANVAKGQVEKSRVLGFHDAKKTFTDLPPEGGLLVGFDLGVGKFFDIETVYALRPIFRTSDGEGSFGDHGLFHDRNLGGKKVLKSKVVRTVSVRARSGYAVGGITLRSGLNINGLSLTFMRINGKALDPRQSYTSTWIGDRTGGSENLVSGNGAPIVGIFGSKDELHIQSLGLYFLHRPASAETPPAVPPRPERPIPASPKAPLRVKAPSNAENPPDKPGEVAPSEPAEVRRKEPSREPVGNTSPLESEDVTGKKADPSAVALDWLPLIVFVLVTGPIILFLLLSYARKGPIEKKVVDKIDLKKAPSAPVPAPLPPTAATAICERPGVGSGKPIPPRDTTFPTRLPDSSREDSPPAQRAEKSLPATQPERTSKPTWRAYHHRACGKTTIVSGDDYVLLECPFRPVSATYCCGCRNFVPLESVHWVDSDEKISDYRRRVAASVSVWRQVYLSLFANAYEGAINWGVEWKGEFEETADSDQ